MVLRLQILVQGKNVQFADGITAYSMWVAPDQKGGFSQPQGLHHAHRSNGTCPPADRHQSLHNAELLGRSPYSVEASIDRTNLQRTRLREERPV